MGRQSVKQIDPEWSAGFEISCQIGGIKINYLILKIAFPDVQALFRPSALFRESFSKTGQVYLPTTSF
ncbi:MAG: hypothetical protein HQK56_08105 [Deltaproteobacteria bacterium]|nr:hypothetical protein [Deltaproteobacteria bacterium]